MGGISARGYMHRNHWKLGKTALNGQPIGIACRLWMARISVKFVANFSRGIQSPLPDFEIQLAMKQSIYLVEYSKICVIV